MPLAGQALSLRLPPLVDQLSRPNPEVDQDPPAPLPVPEGAGAMDKTVARLNIAHYKRKLADEADETKRLVLLGLLDEEETKLKALLSRSPETKLRPL